MNSIKQEVEVVEEELFDYPTQTNKEISIPSRWLLDPIDINIESDGELNICTLCQFVEGAPLTYSMKRKRNYHMRWCLTQRNICHGCGFNLISEPRTRLQKSKERRHLQTCSMENII